MTEIIVRNEFLTGALLRGRLLAGRLQQDLLPPEDAFRYSVEIGAALSRAHASGVVHGSVSPYSIILTENGAAALAEPGPSIPENLAYRAPEQVRGEAPDWRSDIFSFGAVLYEMVDGAPAFTGEGAQLDNAILGWAPPPLTPRSPVHVAMVAVITGCLEKDPAARRQRIQNAVTELKLAGGSLPRVADARQRSVADAPAYSTATADSSALNLPSAVKPKVESKVEPKVEPKVEAKIEAKIESKVEPNVDPAFEPPVDQPLSPAVLRPKGGFRTRFWMLTGVLMLLCVAGVAAVMLLPRNAAPVARFSVEPENSKYPGMPAISPDGHYLSWAATGPTGKRMLWVRALDETHAKLVPDTEGAGGPFWSPDSQYVGFFANRLLQKTRVVDGSPGAPQTICPVESLAGGGAWNKDGTILFAPGLSSGLWRVPSTGGKPQPVTTLNDAKFERSHLWPQFLPDGKNFIFFELTDMEETSGVYTAALDSRDAPNRLFSSETNAVYAAGPRTFTSKSGYLLYIRSGSLVGQPFSPSKLETTGEAITLANNVGPVASYSLAQISVSDNGTLAYQSAGKPARQLVWMDRAGKVLSTLGEPGNWGPPRISPDGKRVVVGNNDPASGSPVLWMLDTDGHASQFSDALRSGVSPVWSPDGSRVAFGNNQLGVSNIYVQPSAGQGKAELVYRSETPKDPEDWSADGRLLLFRDFKPGMSSGIYALNMSDRKAAPAVDTIHFEGYAALSHDEKWLAYQSDEEQGMQVLVQAFENGAPGTKKFAVVSPNGGGLPRWRRDGGELYYMTQSGQMYAATFHAKGADFTVDPPRELFHTRPFPKSWNLYDVSPDGERFLMNIPMEWPSSSPITVIPSWIKALAE